MKNDNTSILPGAPPAHALDGAGAPRHRVPCPRTPRPLASRPAAHPPRSMMNDEWHKHLIITLSNARRKAAAAAAVAGEILQLYLQAATELDALNYRAGCRPLMTQSFAFNHSSDAAAALSTRMICVWPGLASF